MALQVRRRDDLRQRIRRGAALLALCLPLSLLSSAAAEQEEPDAAPAPESFEPERCAEQVAADALEVDDDEVVAVPLDDDDAQPARAEAPDQGHLPDADAVPDQWAPTQGRGCHRYHGRRVCEGPRRVPVPQGEAAERARELGLGSRRSATVLLRRGPRPEWLEAIETEAEPRLHWPVDDGRLWRGFGYVRRGRRRRRLHEGIDVGAPAGTLIRAVRSGLVTYSDNGIRGYGNVILILHADATVALYAHNRANYVFAGQLVRQGRAIGEVGDTGLAHGAHLHLELRRDGRPFDPIDLFDQRPQQP